MFSPYEWPYIRRKASTMKKIRYLPFGYQIIQGEIVEKPSEIDLVKSIYEKYLQGSSIKKLALYAEQTGIPYRENAECWNKNMITRILEDERYWNGKRYPPIISKELALKAGELKKSKVEPHTIAKHIRQKVSCSICGTYLTRNSKKKPKIFWDCKECKKRFGPITDGELLKIITQKFLVVCQNPELSEPAQISGNSLSIQVGRLTNEINQTLNQREVEPDKMLQLILDCAAEKYKISRIIEADHVTIKIKTLLQEHSDDKELDRQLFEQTVKEVILLENGSVQLRLQNEKII